MCARSFRGGTGSRGVVRGGDADQADRDAVVAQRVVVLERLGVRHDLVCQPGEISVGVRTLGAYVSGEPRGTARRRGRARANRPGVARKARLPVPDRSYAATQSSEPSATTAQRQRLSWPMIQLAM